MSTERLSDAEISELLQAQPERTFFEAMPNGGLVRLLAREVQERRQADKDAAPVAPVGDEPNPYGFTIEVEWSDVALDWVIVLADSHERMFMEWACPTEAEAREHARLIAAALRTVEVTE